MTPYSPLHRRTFLANTGVGLGSVALNALLFLLIGIEVFAIDYSHREYLFAAALLIPLVLVARFAGVAGPLWLLRNRVRIGRGAIPVLTWGGLKGGVSIALAKEVGRFRLP